MKIKVSELRSIIEEVKKSVPFGTGMKPVKGLDSDQKDIIGHT
jgi:hypothetical protein